MTSDDELWELRRENQRLRDALLPFTTMRIPSYVCSDSTVYKAKQALGQAPAEDCEDCYRTPGIAHCDECECGMFGYQDPNCGRACPTCSGTGKK